MSNLYLFESGSTKTTLLITGNSPESEIREEVLDGYNPNRPSVLFLEQLQKLNIRKEDHVFFYGSGLGSEHNKSNLRKLFFDAFAVEVAVFDDITGAGRALFGNDSGLLAIMGTGGCAAYFNGTTIQKRHGGYGYLIDDWGGGYELGKSIVSAWLNDQLPAQLNNELNACFNIGKSEFTAQYYGMAKENLAEALQQISAVVRLIPQYMNEPEVNALVKNYFSHFFESHILPLKEQYGVTELGLVGSIADAFKNTIYQVALECELELQKIVRYPALSLVGYHQEKTLSNKNTL